MGKIYDKIEDLRYPFNMVCLASLTLFAFALFCKVFALMVNSVGRGRGPWWAVAAYYLDKEWGILNWVLLITLGVGILAFIMGRPTKGKK